MDVLTSRELAILIWLVGVSAWGLRKQKVRAALAHLAQAALDVRIRRVVVALCAYVACVVAILAPLGIWQPEQLKATMTWTAFSATASVYRTVMSPEGSNPARAWLKDTIKIVVVVEFIATSATLPLLGELILTPFLFVVGGMLALASGKAEHRQVERFLKGVLVMIGLGAIALAARDIFADVGAFASLATLREFCTPPLLSLTLIPFLFGLYVYSTYETAFAPLPVIVPDNRLRAFARRRALLTFRHRAGLARRWMRALQLDKPRSRDAVLRSIDDIARDARGQQA